jgi:hypothetical protein
MTQQVFISVRNGRAFVSRYVTEEDGSFSWESAINALDLESDALAAVVAQGGQISRSGEYNCPVPLAERALWHSQE